MASEATLESVIHRRRLRRKLTVWRLVAFAALAAALIALLWAGGAFRGGVGGLAAATPHIARVTISGVITEDRKLISLLERIGESDAVQGVILRVDSPGGTAVGGEAIYEAVRKLAAKKPVTASVSTLAASAGYMVAAGTDHIVARNTSIVGSIGVIVQVPQVAGLLDKIGVEVREIKSAPLKAEPSPFNETTPAEEAMIRRMVNSSYGWFVDLVTERRPLSRAEVLRVADGSVFSGMQALDLKLVDALGGEEVAQAWLTAERNLDGDLDVRDWKVQRGGGPFGLGAWGDLGERLGAGSALAEELRAVRKLVPERLFLDGMIAIWQK